MSANTNFTSTDTKFTACTNADSVDTLQVLPGKLRLFSHNPNAD
jgi:hypothetical protein